MIIVNGVVFIYYIFLIDCYYYYYFLPHITVKYKRKYQLEKSTKTNLTFTEKSVYMCVNFKSIYM